MADKGTGKLNKLKKKNKSGKGDMTKSRSKRKEKKSNSENKKATKKLLLKKPSARVEETRTKKPKTRGLRKRVKNKHDFCVPRAQIKR